jgi:hypothetical protein
LFSSGSVQIRVGGSCEYRCEPLGPTSDGEVLKQLNDSQLLKKDTVLWSQFRLLPVNKDSSHTYVHFTLFALIYNSVSRTVWVRNLVSHFEGRT